MCGSGHSLPPARRVCLQLRDNWFLDVKIGSQRVKMFLVAASVKSKPLWVCVAKIRFGVVASVRESQDPASMGKIPHRDLSCGRGGQQDPICGCP